MSSVFQAQDDFPSRVAVTTVVSFCINHPKCALYQPHSGKLNLQNNISIIAVFLCADTSIYLALESSAVEPANSERPETMGAIKSDISNGKVNSVFQMHFLEDGGSGSRGLIHCK